jgi:hypothetical protein
MIRKILCVFFLFLYGSIAAKEKNLDTHDLQIFQSEFDEQHWQINMGFEKLRHILLHLVKTTGKVAAFCDAKEHGKIEPDPAQLINEVLPDLLMHALQIANLYNVDLGKKYAERIEHNKKR